ncbi:MAG: bifunctional diaminohydroxyphosphoribosylaminopyrimidine deaminase/5-amino-6-(5-phosphoribosylamino)uracil reductase RibD [Bacteroidota bacterium]
MEDKHKDVHYLARCNQLAAITDAQVYPNPRVGALIVYEDKIIGEGFHRKAGLAHAEVLAVASVKDKSLLSKSTMYVSLEPCNHYGRTPPCTEMIIRNKIPRVVIGSLDPNPKVAGGGVARLRKAGVEVIGGKNVHDCIQLNKAFFVNQVYKKAFILLKWAESSDHFMAKLDENGKGVPTPISASHSLLLVHKLRSQHHAIMIGKNTALNDNPQLNTRRYPGQDPIRIIFDRSLSLPQHLNIFQDGRPSIILNEIKSEQIGPLQYHKTPNLGNLSKLSEELYRELGICSVLVEGGSNLLQQFIEQEVYDEIWRVEAKKKLFKGISGPALPKNLSYEHKILDKFDSLFYTRGKSYLDLFENSAMQVI